MHMDFTKTNLLIPGEKNTTLKVKGEHNTECQIKSGVPQGSLPGVLLFNIYLNYMFDSIEAHLFHFANDNYL